ncbi:MAG: FAD-dependent oxidoreductase, partial [Clostridia bacterium]|nr:FAD-dependent oxidoreductase [Clostridia bacterium]
MKCFEKILKNNDVDVKLNTAVKKILTEENRSIGVEIDTGEQICADCVV